MKKLFVAVLLLCATTAIAQGYPAKPVRWVVPFPPGGGTDLISRVIAAELSKLWGVQVVADNRPGGGGTLGLGIAAKMPAVIETPQLWPLIFGIPLTELVSE